MRRSNRILTFWAIAGMLATVALYARHLEGPFFFDDSPSVLENPRVKQLWPPAWAWHESDNPLAGRPVPAFTLALDFALHGRQAAGYRAFNLALHLANALLLLLIVRRLLARSPGLRSTAPEAAGIAGAVATLWALHPLQTEAVIYVTQRTELVVALCYLATLWCSMRGFDSVSSRQSAKWYGLACAACLVGALSKEVIATAPLAVLLYDRAFVSDGFRGALRERKGLYAGLAASWLLLAALVLAGPRAAAVAIEQQVSPLDYLRTQAGVIAEYLRLCFWPDALRLSYPPWTARTWADFPTEGAVVVVLAVATLWACWRRPRVGFAGAWFFLVLAPSSSVVPVTTEIAAQRRMYLALAAVVGLAVVGCFVGLRALARRVAAERAAWGRALPVAGVGLAAAAAFAFAWRADERLADYRSRVAIWHAEARTDPDNPTAFLNLAMALLEEGRYPQATAALDQAAQALGRLDRPTQAVVLRTTSLGVLAVLYPQMGRPDLGLRLFRKLAADHPDLVEVQLPYGQLCLLADAAREAVAPLERAVALAPEAREAWSLLAEAYSRTGRPERAEAALDQAIERAEGAERERLVTRRERLRRRGAAP